MHQLAASLVILFVLCLQFNHQHALNIHLPALDESEDRPSSFNSWYTQLNDMEESDQEENVDHLWKRFSPDLSTLRQKRRFGNTRYGRSLPQN